MAFAIVGVLNGQVGSNGWSEKYFFKGSVTTLVGALPLMQQIVWGRTAFLASGCSITFARVSSTNSAHDGLACQLPFPLGPHPSWGPDTAPNPGDRLGPVNDPEVCCQQRFETNVGNFWQRYYRCIPDSWITNKVLTTGINAYLQPLPTGAPVGDMSPTGGLSHLAVCQTFWSYLIANTAYAKKTGGGNYTLSDFQFIQFRQVTSKKIGRPFGVSRGRRPATLVQSA